MTRVAILEDDEKIRGYLTALISGSGQFEVVKAFDSAEAAIEHYDILQEADVDLLLSDIELPDKNGIDFISWFKPRFPGVNIMILSSYEDSDRVFRALRAGATGYVLKTTPAVKLIEALNELKDGGSPMTSQIARMVVNAFQQHKVAVANPLHNLSTREQEVLQSLAQGYRYQEIADKLFISVETVRTHIRNIYDKLQARNKREALRNANLA